MKQTPSQIEQDPSLFNAIAMLMSGSWRRQASSSEDLGGVSFDQDHTELEQFVQSVPKVELHVHLDGAFDPHRLWAHLKQRPELLQCFPVEKQLPWAKPDEPKLPIRKLMDQCDSVVAYRHLCTCRRRYRNLRHDVEAPSQKPQGSLEDMLTCFEFFLPLVYDNIELLEDLAYDFVQRQYEQNVIYTEVRYSPHLLAQDPHQAFEAITRGLRRGCQEFDVIVTQILCAIDFQPQWASDVVEMAHLHRNATPCEVVGVDIAAGESHYNPSSPMWKDHYEMCQRAQELGLSITLHAGETPESAHNVGTAINSHGASRIGHAYRMVANHELLDEVREKNIHIEICPTSSVETGGWQKTVWKDHPVNTFRDRGISVSLSSDDPAVFNTSLTWQYRIALIKMGWNCEDIVNMVEKAIDACFWNEDGKEKLRAKLQGWDATNNPLFRDRVHYEDGHES
eukprot:Nitzschia sp. Nitz4//scaffold119_size111653//1814//3243//NITZ4_004171-RA/size111653-snap-gene-0.69-mRNA-1//-1//CDS//3329533779//9306//frame0